MLKSRLNLSTFATVLCLIFMLLFFLTMKNSKKMDKSLKIRKVRERVGDEQQYKEYKVLKMKISINIHRITY